MAANIEGQPANAGRDRRALRLEQGEIRKVARVFKTQITPYYASLIKDKGDPIYRQVVPDPAELERTAASPIR